MAMRLVILRYMLHRVSEERHIFLEDLAEGAPDIMQKRMSLPA